MMLPAANTSIYYILYLNIRKLMVTFAPAVMSQMPEQDVQQQQIQLNN